MHRLLALSVWILISCSAFAVDRQRLLELLEFPLVHFEMGFVFAGDGIRLFGSGMQDEPSPEERIVEAERKTERKPGDPAALYELGSAYWQNGETNKGDAAFAESIRLFEERLAKKPKRPELAAGLARALLTQNRTNEADQLLRSYLAKYPKDTSLWAAGAELASSRALRILMRGEHLTLNQQTLEQMFTTARANRMSHEEKAAFDAAIVEAHIHFANALRLDPKDLETRRRRMTFRAFVEAFRALPEAETPQDAFALILGRYISALREDSREIARLTPKDVTAVTAAAMVDLMSDAIESGSDKLCCDWSGMPEASKERLRSWTARLQKLTRSGAAAQRLQAFASVGFLQFVQQDYAGAAKSLRSAIALDPDAQFPWELLITVQAGAKDWAALEGTCRERAQQHDSARNQFILAKSIYHQDRADDAWVPLKHATELDPNHVESQLALILVSLQSGQTERRDEAAALLNTLGTSKQLSPDKWRQVTLYGGAWYALSGDTATAADWFDNVLESHPDDETAKKALELLASSK